MLGQLAKQLGVTDQLLNQFPLLNGSQCAVDLQALGAGLQQQQLWAMQSKHVVGPQLDSSRLDLHVVGPQLDHSRLVLHVVGPQLDNSRLVLR